VVEYLRQHGEADLTAWIVSVAREYPAWIGRVRTATHHDSDQLFGVFRLMSAFRQALMAAGGALELLVLCGAACLVLLALGRRPRPITWAGWKWALVASGCLAVALGTGVAAQGWRAWCSPLPGFSDEITAAPWGRLMALMGLPLLVAATGVVVWAVRRRVAPSERPGFTRHYAGTLTAVLLPLTAVMLAGCVIMSVPLVARAAAEAHRCRTIIYQSELVSCGLQPPTPFAPAPAPQGKGPLGGQE
jgi:hypothetical protein